MIVARRPDVGAVTGEAEEVEAEEAEIAPSKNVTSEAKTPLEVTITMVIKSAKSLIRLASPAGLEPAAHSLGNCCSILLSYGDPGPEYSSRK
jgi:hypothetical protein